jgi:CHAT domain-containing protein
MSRNITFDAITLGIALAAGASLFATMAHAQSSNLKDSIAEYEQKLAQARASRNMHDVVSELNILGSLYRMSGQLEKALTYLNEALPIEQRASSLYGQATTLDTMGRVYTDLGQEDKALALLNQALPMWRALNQRTGEADTLNYIGKVYNNEGQHDDALKYLNQAMAIWQQIDNPASGPSTKSNISTAGEAGTLDNLGRTYSDEGQGETALGYFNKALPLYNEINERGGAALVLNDMGPTFAGIGQKQKALEAYNKALDIWRALGSREGEALTLNNIGRLYRDLGQQETALDYYNQALPIWRETGNRSGEALALSDMGRAYADLGQPQKALDYSNQALPIFRETGSRRGEAMTLNNMGREHSDLNDPTEAMKLDLDSLAIWREIKDQRNEAGCLMTIGWAYSQMKQVDDSLSSALAALDLAKSTGDPEIEGMIENSMMIGYRKQQRPEEAIFFGLQAVNSYQQLRKNISGLDKELQEQFAQSRAGAYRMLAELLVETGQLGQAEQILDLLKEQELEDLVPGSAPGADAGFQPLELSTAQQHAAAALPDLEKRARAIEELSLQYAQIQAKPAHGVADDAQLKSLEGSMEEQSKAIRHTLMNDVYTPLDLQLAPGLVTDEGQSLLEKSLRKLGPNVIGIRLLLGEDHAYAIVVHAGVRSEFVLPASSADLRGKAFDALKAITSPSTDPRPQLNQLYAMIVAPLEGELKAVASFAAAKGATPTLLWSLDDALRYVPMGALYDGHQYLVERFHNVLFTPESYSHIADGPIPDGEPPNALAMGLSKSYGGLPALPGVIPELESIVHDPAVPDSHGPMHGKLLPDDQFTLSALRSELGANREPSSQGFSIVHIASHFVLESGAGDEPYLMMGGDNSSDANGFEWNLSAMENSQIAFKGTRLLTLSACSTAKDYKSRNGFEMDGLGMVAQQKDAEAVLATLWDVNDLSTSRIMSDFYDRWLKNPSQGKAEALRQAQLAFVHGSAAAGNAKTGRGFETTDQTPAPSSSLGYAHPYYWAPFVLIGNYQ